MIDEKTIHIRLCNALMDAITIERIPVRRYEMERLLHILTSRYKSNKLEKPTLNIGNDIPEFQG